MKIPTYASGDGQDQPACQRSPIIVLAPRKNYTVLSLAIHRARSEDSYQIAILSLQRAHIYFYIMGSNSW